MSSELKFPQVEGGKVVCQECGKSFRLITPSHLKQHDLTMAEYKLKYLDCPISYKEYEASRFKFKDSALFKSTEGEPKPGLEYPEPESEEPVFEKSIINYDGVPKNKAEILKYLHDTYHNLVNNFSIEKRHFYDNSLTYKYITDMADPVQKVLYDFPDAFWHNNDPYPDHQKFAKLKADGWIVVVIDKHYPTVNDVIDNTDFISD